MGLDMMLYRERYVDNEVWNSKLKKYEPKKLELVETYGADEEVTPLEGVLFIREEVATWRKQYAIHSWLRIRASNNRYYEVGIEELYKLLKLCKRLLEELKLEGGMITNPEVADRLLPCGRYMNYDDYYYYGIEQTVEQLERVLSYPDAKDYCYIYDWSD